MTVKESDALVRQIVKNYGKESIDGACTPLSIQALLPEGVTVALDDVEPTLRGVGGRIHDLWGKYHLFLVWLNGLTKENFADRFVEFRNTEPSFRGFLVSDDFPHSFAIVNCDAASREFEIYDGMQWPYHRRVSAGDLFSLLGGWQEPEHRLIGVFYKGE